MATQTPTEAMAQLALLIGAYYTELVRQGMPHDAALKLSTEFQVELIRQGQQQQRETTALWLNVLASMDGKGKA